MFSYKADSLDPVGVLSAPKANYCSNVEGLDFNLQQSRGSWLGIPRSHRF